MHILMIPSWLGTSNKWQTAVGSESFFLDQAEIVRHHLGWRVDVMMPEAKHKIKIRRRHANPLPHDSISVDGNDRRVCRDYRRLLAAQRK